MAAVSGLRHDGAAAQFFVVSSIGLYLAVLMVLIHIDNLPFYTELTETDCRIFKDSVVPTYFLLQK